MLKRTFLIAAGVLALGLTGARADTTVAAPKLDPANTVYLDVPAGRVVIALRPDLAPKMVARFKQLCHEHFYDGTPFHRVIAGFMAQGGDPTGTGEGGSKYPNVPAEFSQSAHFVRGTVGAARTSDPDTANSQFFIDFAPAPNLDGQYTIFGQVVSGMQYIDALKKGDPESGHVDNPDKIIKMRVANDP
jgi:peptidylprolyl isomerase